MGLAIKILTFILEIWILVASAIMIFVSYFLLDKKGFSKKKVANIFIVVGMLQNLIVCGLYVAISDIYCITSSSGFSVAVYSILIILTSVYFLLSVIFGEAALNKLKTTKSKSEFTGLAICVLLFCNLIAGILMLCISDAELSENATSTRQPKRIAPAQNQDFDNELTTELENLNSLKNNGLITDTEYENLRKNAIGKYLNK
jgi:predicted permease